MNQNNDDSGLLQKKAETKQADILRDVQTKPEVLVSNHTSKLETTNMIG